MESLFVSKQKLYQNDIKGKIPMYKNG